MSVFYPDYTFSRIFMIPSSFFQERGISTLLIDVDNTLTTDNNPVPHGEVLAWLDAQRAAGLRLLALSNNRRERVAPFAARLGLEYIAGAAKPLPAKVNRALKKMGILKGEAAVIGDQLFTDILCGRLAGCTTILVEPMELEGYGFFKLKRPVEERILRRYRARRKGRGL